MKREFDQEYGKNYNGRVAAYMRYSSNNQDEDSIAYQSSAIMAYAHTRGYHIAVEYIDEARTGTNDRREGFQELIADAQRKPEWGKILVYDLSRFSRNNQDSIRYTAMLEDMGIEIVSVTQEFDNSPEGALMRGMVNLLNEYYSRNLARYTHAGLKLRAKDCKHCGGIPPLGYDVVEDMLVVNQAEAEIVKLIFDMYELNYSYSQMAEELNKRGCKNKNGTPFSKNSFADLLRQKKYIGTYTWNKSRKKNNQGCRNTHKEKPEEEQIILKDAIPAIIDKEQFERVQERIRARQNGTAQSKSRHYYLLGSLDKLKCAECGSNLVGTTRKSHGIEYQYYYCPNHRRKQCTTKEIRADYLNKFVVNTVIDDIYKRKDLKDIFNNTGEKGRIKMLKAKVKGLEKSSRNLVKSLCAEPNEEIRNKLKSISADKQALQVELEDLTNRQQTMTDENRKEICKKLAKMMLQSESFEVKQYLASVIDSITVSNTDIELTLNIA
jgi:site-specific DNA recombinase